MEIEHVLFSSNTQKMSETCQKLAFTHPIVVLKSGLKNNWIKKLDHVNRPLDQQLLRSLPFDHVTEITCHLFKMVQFDFEEGNL